MTSYSIALDVESTLADTGTPFRDEYESRNGWRPGEWTDWDFEDVDFDVREYLEITGHNWKHNTGDIPPTERNLAAKVFMLYEDAEYLDIVTGRKGFQEYIEAWLATQGVAYDDYVEVDGQAAKADLGYDIYIDDAPRHVDEIGDDQFLFLYDQPYNRDMELPANAVRVRSLAQAKNLIESASGDIEAVA